MIVKWKVKLLHQYTKEMDHYPSGRALIGRENLV